MNETGFDDTFIKSTIDNSQWSSNSQYCRQWNYRIHKIGESQNLQKKIVHKFSSFNRIFFKSAISIKQFYEWNIIAMKNVSLGKYYCFYNRVYYKGILNVLWLLKYTEIPLPGLLSIKTILFVCSSRSAALYERHDGELKLMI